MEYVQLGRTGLKVSRLCLGTMNFGPQRSEADSLAIMDQALELGINFFDTAERVRLEDGRGRHRADRRPLVRAGRGRREQVVLATKVYGKMGDGPNDVRLSARHIRRGLRREPAAPQDGLHRPLPDASRRPGHAVGRDLAGDGDASSQQGKVIYVG